ncbi:MAG TPA: hypothetical protein VF468_20400 [Actinomycetota bacterium]|nr:hypothetical protein [Actinomycetota bacterium]
MKLTRPPRTRLQRDLARPLGQEVDGSEAAYRRVGSDRDHGIALVALSLR